MPPRLDSVFRGRDAIADGLVTPAQLRSEEYQRIFRGLYCRNTTMITHVLRCHAATLALPESAVITGRSAATVRGLRLCWPEDPVQVSAPLSARIARVSGLHVRRTELRPDEWEPWSCGRLATSMRMAMDLLLGFPLPDAVADLDAVLRAGLVDRTLLAQTLAGRSDNGIVRARQAVALADPAAESLPESRLRVHLVLDGLEPQPQYRIRDVNRHEIARTDLGFPERKVAVEYDGDWRDGELWALNRDRDRLNRVHAAGWDVVFVTAPMLRTPRKAVGAVRAALAR